ncbi:hypothetical protein BH20VER2_BH20VER2_10700 [soil metagenome]
MKTLALELSCSGGSLALVEGEEEKFAREFANDRKHSGAFFENLEVCLRETGMPQRIVVGLGPGSYAGTRIAIAAATGLHVATGAELRGVPSLCTLRTDAPEYGVIGDARRGSFFFARVRERKCVEGPILCTAQDLEQWIAATGVPVFSPEVLPAFPGVLRAQPSARILARLQLDDHDAAAGRLEPIYLREPHITQPKPVPCTAIK